MRSSNNASPPPAATADDVAYAPPPPPSRLPSQPTSTAAFAVPSLSTGVGVSELSLSVATAASASPTRDLPDDLQPGWPGGSQHVGSLSLEESTTLASSASNSNDEANTDSSPPTSSKVLLGASDGSTSGSPVHPSDIPAATSRPAWKCKFCTFDNLQPYAKKCAACNQKRPPNKLKRRSPGAMMELASKRQVQPSVAGGHAAAIDVAQAT